MSQTLIPPRAAPPTQVTSLENGDHLDQPTFHRLYEETPEDFKAELIGGIVYVASPVSRQHSDAYSTVAVWLGYYRAMTPGVKSPGDGTVILSEFDEVQPDCVLHVMPECGGRIRSQDKYLAGGPDLVCEISTSSAAIDLHRKLRAYEAAGVREYVVLTTEPRAVYWFRLKDGVLQQVTAPEDGVYRSIVFPGLWLDGEAILRDDAKKVVETLQLGLADKSHAAFVEELNSRRDS